MENWGKSGHLKIYLHSVCSVPLDHTDHIHNNGGLEYIFHVPFGSWVYRIKFFWTFHGRDSGHTAVERSRALKWVTLLSSGTSPVRASPQPGTLMKLLGRKWRAFSVSYSCTYLFPTKINFVRLFAKDHSIQRWLVAQLCIYLFPCPFNCRTSQWGERMIFIFFITHL